MTDSVFSAPARTLSIRATLTLATGYAYPLTADDIVSYHLSEGVSGGDMLLGSALSAHGRLTLSSPGGAWKKGGSRLGDRTLSGATAEIEIGADSGSGFVYSSAGSFIVSAVDAPEGEDIVTLSGYDAVLHRFQSPLNDTLAYPCTLQAVLSHIAQQAQCVIAGTPLCNGNVLIAKRPDWGEGCTLRRALSCAAAAMGCFVRLSRSGPVTLVPAVTEHTHSLNAGNCYAMTLSGAGFAFNRLRVFPCGAQGGHYCEYAVNGALPAGADNTVEMTDNPLFRAGSSETETLVRNLGSALSSLSFTPFSLTCPGNPAVEAGDHLLLTDLSGQTHRAVVFSQQLTFENGLTAALSCDFDTAGVNLPRVITAAGKLSAAALSDGLIAARHLAAGSVDAEKITARAITADHIALGALTAQSGVIGDLSADLVTSGKLHTDRLIIGGTEFSIVRALNQLANSLSENNSTIDGDVISDKSISAVKVTDDFGAGLELSSNAAVLMLAGKLDGTNSHLELTPSAISMVGGDIHIATNDLSIRGMDDGGEIMSLDPEGLFARRVVVTGSLSAPNVLGSFPGAEAAWKGGIQSSLDALPKHLQQDCTLTVPAGTYAENVRVHGFTGSRLTLHFSPGTQLCGSVTLDGCTAVTLYAEAAGDAILCPPDASTPVTVRHCRHAQLENLQISGLKARTDAGSGADCGICVRAGAVTIRGCCVEYTRSGIYLTDGAAGTVENCCGGSAGSSALTNANVLYGVLADAGAHAALIGSIPMGGTAASRAESATLLGAPAALAGTAALSPGSTTVTLRIQNHCTYLSGQSRIRADQSPLLSQGRYGAYAQNGLGWRIGAMWFEGGEALQDKSILRATLTLRRASGGWSNPVPVYLGTSALTHAACDSTLQPPFTPLAAYPAGNLARETENVYDVTALSDAIRSGHAISLFEPRTEYSGEFSPAYTHFYGKGSSYEPFLTIEYQ